MGFDKTASAACLVNHLARRFAREANAPAPEGPGADAQAAFLRTPGTVVQGVQQGRMMPGQAVTRARPTVSANRAAVPRRSAGHRGRSSPLRRSRPEGWRQGWRGGATQGGSPERHEAMHHVMCRASWPQSSGPVRPRRVARAGDVRRDLRRPARGPAAEDEALSPRTRHRPARCASCARADPRRRCARGLPGVLRISAKGMPPSGGSGQALPKRCAGSGGRCRRHGNASQAFGTRAWRRKGAEAHEANLGAVHRDRREGDVAEGPTLALGHQRQGHRSGQPQDLDDGRLGPVVVGRSAEGRIEGGPDGCGVGRGLGSDLHDMLPSDTVVGLRPHHAPAHGRDAVGP